MQIILLSTGEGVARAETMYLKSGKIPFEFVGAPAYSVITAVSDTHTIRRNLTDKCTCEFDVLEMQGDFTFTVSSRDKVWYCDGLRIETAENGDVRVCSLTNYADHFKTMADEINSLRKQLVDTNAAISTLRDDVEREMRQYHII
jgi:hypothetical protein